MDSGIGEMGDPMGAPYNSGGDVRNDDSGDFECTICYKLAHDPIVTLCGHLYCWPCLYRWLHIHSRSSECPVCKAHIQEDKLVPIYGRGKTFSDHPMSRSVPALEIPNRPAAQRPETARSHWSSGIAEARWFPPVVPRTVPMAAEGWDPIPEGWDANHAIPGAQWSPRVVPTTWGDAAEVANPPTGWESDEVPNPPTGWE